jgi:Holliday junction resolvase RusA-like endonuclease
MEGSETSHAIALIEPLCSVPEFHAIVIDGEPVSKARPRFTGNGRPYTPKRTRDGEAMIAARFSCLPKFASNVAVGCIFYRSTFQRVDIDNLLKAILDGATRAQLWGDDSQVTAIIGVLEYDRTRPRTVVAFGEHASSLGRGEDAKATCESCGKRFVAAGRRRETARWCSRECRMTLAESVECPGCHTPFKRRTANQIYCSSACRGKGQTARAALRVRCAQGHELTPENTRVDPKTQKRRCRACDALAARARRAPAPEEQAA